MRISKSIRVAATATNVAAPLGLAGFTLRVRVVSNVPVYLNLNAPATSTCFYLPAGMSETLDVCPGDILNVIRDGATDGFVNLVEIN